MFTRQEFQWNVFFSIKWYRYLKARSVIPVYYKRNTDLNVVYLVSVAHVHGRDETCIHNLVGKPEGKRHGKEHLGYMKGVDFLTR
jgi:hypothetical protein